MKTLFYCVALALVILSAEAPMFLLAISVGIFCLAAEILSRDFQENKD